jgi:hypothetical protein
MTFERTAEDKIRVTTTSWDDAKVILPNQVLEAAVIGKQVRRAHAGAPQAHGERVVTALHDREMPAVTASRERRKRMR